MQKQEKGKLSVFHKTIVMKYLHFDEILKFFLISNSCHETCQTIKIYEFEEDFDYREAFLIKKILPKIAILVVKRFNFDDPTLFNFFRAAHFVLNIHAPISLIDYMKLKREERIKNVEAIGLLESGIEWFKFKYYILEHEREMKFADIMFLIDDKKEKYEFNTKPIILNNVSCECVKEITPRKIFSKNGALKAIHLPDNCRGLGKKFNILWKKFKVTNDFDPHSDYNRILFEEPPYIVQKGKNYPYNENLIECENVPQYDICISFIEKPTQLLYFSDFCFTNICTCVIWFENVEKYVNWVVGFKNKPKILPLFWTSQYEKNAFVENKLLILYNAPCMKYARSNLRFVVLANGIEFLQKGMFEDCGLLSIVILPLSLREIKGRAFFGCTCLRKLLIPPLCRIFNEEIEPYVSNNNEEKKCESGEYERKICPITLWTLRLLSDNEIQYLPLIDKNMIKCDYLRAKERINNKREYYETIQDLFKDDFINLSTCDEYFKYFFDDYNLMSLYGLNDDEIEVGYYDNEQLKRIETNEKTCIQKNKEAQRMNDLSFLDIEEDPYFYAKSPVSFGEFENCEDDSYNQEIIDFDDEDSYYEEVDDAT